MEFICRNLSDTTIKNDLNLQELNKLVTETIYAVHNLPYGGFIWLQILFEQIRLSQSRGQSDVRKILANTLRSLHLMILQLFESLIIYNEVNYLALGTVITWVFASCRVLLVSEVDAILRIVCGEDNFFLHDSFPNKYSSIFQLGKGLVSSYMTTEKVNIDQCSLRGGQKRQQRDSYLSRSSDRFSNTGMTLLQVYESKNNENSNQGARFESIESPGVCEVVHIRFRHKSIRDFLVQGGFPSEQNL